MADPIPPAPAPIADRPIDPEVYRPLSGAALAGFALAALFAGLVLVTTLLALVRGVPFFLPGWMGAVPAAAAVLSYLGLRHVRNSEGTRAGEGLARWGLGLSAFVGLGYYAYVTFTGLALTQQAHGFLTEKDEDSGFFPRLIEGGRELHQAFLLTLPPPARLGSRPDSDKAMRDQYDQPTADHPKGALTAFLEHPVVVLLSTAGGRDRVTIEPLGVKDWKYEDQGYQVARTYRLRTPVAVADIVVPARSFEGEEEGERRKWFVNVRQMRHSSVTLTPHGEALSRLRGQAAQFAGDWAAGLNRGQAWPDFAKKDRTAWEQLHPPKLREQARHGIAQLFAAERPGRMQLAFPPQDMPRGGEDVGGHLRLALPMVLRLVDKQSGNPLEAEGRLVVQTRQPYDPARPPEAAPAWVIEAIQFDRVAPMSKDKVPPQAFGG